MPACKLNSVLSESDADFLIETVSPDVRNKTRLRQILREDDDIRNSYVTDEKTLQRVLNEEESFVKISPALFFEVLLRRTARDLEGAGYTFERSGRGKIPVFDTAEITELLKKEELVRYLADMLSSFTRVQSYSFSSMVRKGVWKRFRFNDLDILSLMRLSEAADEEYRLSFYKRIADICLFILGMFPDFAERQYRYPHSGQVRPHVRGTLRISPEDYATEGRKFYLLAAEHPSARELCLEEVFRDLHRNFDKAKKPLNFIVDHYLPRTRDRYFG
jgi:hypothetical protein